MEAQELREARVEGMALCKERGRDCDEEEVKRRERKGHRKVGRLSE